MRRFEEWSGLSPHVPFCAPARKAWTALIGQLNGKLRNVQAIGNSPQRVGKDSTEVYSLGAFLLAGSQRLIQVAIDGARRRDHHRDGADPYESGR